MYTCPFSLRFFSHIDYHWILGRVLCLYSRSPLANCSYSSVCICQSQTLSPAFSPICFGYHKFFKVCQSISVLQISSFAYFFKNYFFIFIFFFFCIFRATPAAYGDSQARWGSSRSCSCQSKPQPQQCQIRGTSAAYIHHSSRQRRILNPGNKARDWSSVLMDTSQINFCWATTGTPFIYLFCF